MNTQTTLRIGTLAILSAAGLAATATAAPETSPSSASSAVGTASQEQALHSFHKASSILGKGVFNRNAERIGDVADLVFERGSGRIASAIVKSGDVLGLGGKSIAVPYHRFGYDLAEDHFTLDMTKEQVSRINAFVPENWAQLDRQAWTGGNDWLDEMFGEDDLQAHRDAFADTLSNARARDFEGEIVSVRRGDWIEGQEQVTAVVRTEDHGTQTVVFGPSWYVMGQEAAPMRGDEIEGKALVIGDPGAERWVLASGEIDGKRLTLREDDGSARWSADASTSAEAESPRRLALLSSLIGAKARGADQEDAGEIDDAVIEQRSGRIAMLAFDPNDNWLGMGDDVKCVPWQVADLAGDREVRIDATKAVLEQAEDWPDDASVYAVPSRLHSVYTVFGVEPVNFEPEPARSGMDGPEADDPWDDDGDFTDAFGDGEKVTVSGEVVGLESLVLQADSQPARAVVVTTGEGDRKVILGPAWFIQQQNLGLRPGDRVTIEGRSAMIDGRSYIAAHSVETNGVTKRLWDEGGTALWNSD